MIDTWMGGGAIDREMPNIHVGDDKSYALWVWPVVWYQTDDSECKEIVDPWPIYITRMHFCMLFLTIVRM